MVEALNLVFILLFVSLVLYGFFQLRGTVKVFFIVVGLIVGLFLLFYNYVQD